MVDAESLFHLYSLSFSLHSLCIVRQEIRIT